MTEYEHLNFYNTGAFGGIELVPSILGESAEAIEVEKPAAVKHAEIIEYLKRLPGDTRATNVDFIKELKIDLINDTTVLNMLKNNVKVDQERSDIDGTLSFQYIKKYKINDMTELKDKINRVRNGILLSDIKDCYPDLMEDFKTMIVGGDIIAIKNKELQSFTLYPRGRAFYSRLTGSIVAEPGNANLRIINNKSLLQEIRRGDAIAVGDSWYRVSCAVGRGGAHEQSGRSTAPLSATSDKEMSDMNVYCDPFTSECLPLDGEYDGSELLSNVRARKHGCTNDVRLCWRQTLDDVKRFKTDDAALEKELLALQLITQPGTQLSATVRVKQLKEKKPRAKRRTRASASAEQHNVHLRGGQMERILSQIGAKALQEGR